MRYVSRYLDNVHLIHDEQKRAALQAKLLAILTAGVQRDDGTYQVVGLNDPDFVKYPVHEEAMIRHVQSWLKQQHFVFAGCEAESAKTILDLAKQALGLTPIKLDIFEKLQELHDEEQQTTLASKLKQDLPMPQRKRGKLDLLAIPTDEAQTSAKSAPLVLKQPPADEQPIQLAMF